MVHLPLLGAKLVVLGLGAAIAGLAFLAARRNRDPLMLILGVAFALLAIGSFLEASLFEILEWDLLTVHTIESAFVLAGLGIIAFVLRPRTRAEGAA